MYAVAVTLLRPSKLKWHVGNFGTVTPAQRIYARILNLCRLGADTNNYMSGLFSTHSVLDFTPISAGSDIVAHGAASVLCYVNESDDAAVSNPKATWFRMMADLTRDSVVTHYQARQANVGQGGAAKTGSATTTITPAANGSMILEAEGQGYECDILGTVSAVDYVTTSLANKSALTADGVEDQWVHQWWGRVPVMLPIDDSMDGKTFGWGVKTYTSIGSYQAFANLRVAALPSNWDTDA